MTWYRPARGGAFIHSSLSCVNENTPSKSRTRRLRRASSLTTHDCFRPLSIVLVQTLRQQSRGAFFTVIFDAHMIQVHAWCHVPRGVHWVHLVAAPRWPRAEHTFAVRALVLECSFSATNLVVRSLSLLSAPSACVQSAIFRLVDLITVLLLLICICTYIRGYRKGIFDSADGSHHGLRGGYCIALYVEASVLCGFPAM